MKFSNVIIATISLVLLGLILDGFLVVAFGSLNSNSTSDLLAFIISFLLSSLVVGYVFALKIQEESKIRAIGVIVVLSTFTFILFLGVWIANPFASPWFKDTLNNDFNKSVWTNYDLAAYSALIMSVDAIITLVINFIGLYAGSMLRKPSAKT